MHRAGHGVDGEQDTRDSRLHHLLDDQGHVEGEKGQVAVPAEHHRPIGIETRPTGLDGGVERVQSLDIQYTVMLTGERCLARVLGPGRGSNRNEGGLASLAHGGVGLRYLRGEGRLMLGASDKLPNIGETPQITIFFHLLDMGLDGGQQFIVLHKPAECVGTDAKRLRDGETVPRQGSQVYGFAPEPVDIPLGQFFDSTRAPSSHRLPVRLPGHVVRKTCAHRFPPRPLQARSKKCSTFPLAPGSGEGTSPSR